METQRRLQTWLETQITDATDVRISGFEQVTFGHSAETILLTINWRDGGGNHTQDAVIRVRPPAPGLLEPYDLHRQFDVLRALVSTPVRAPRPLWYEPSGEVLGRDFYVMERLAGTVYERTVPDELAAQPDQIRTICESLIEQLAPIHAVDLKTTGLDRLGDGRGFLGRELDHWQGEIKRVQRGPLLALEQLAGTLREQQPEQCPTVTLVHGDAKPGNFAFHLGEVSGVFDWEGATIGDPLSDVGWAEVLWPLPGSITSTPGAVTRDDFVARWEQLTGIEARHRAWYRAFQAFKMAAIQLVAGHLVHAGFSDDIRLKEMSHAFKFMTQIGLRELGIDEPLPTQTVAREEPAPEAQDQSHP